MIFQSSWPQHRPYWSAFQQGLIPTAVIDTAVGRVLRAKFALGLFEHPYVDVDAAARVNGAPNGTQRTTIDGMDGTNQINAVQAGTGASMDAIQESAIQTSNFAAEYGQVGGGLLIAIAMALPAGATRNHGMPDSGSGDVRMATSCEARPFPAIDRAEHGLSLRARRCTLLRAGSSRQRRRAASAPRWATRLNSCKPSCRLSRNCSRRFGSWDCR